MLLGAATLIAFMLIEYFEKNRGRMMRILSLFAMFETILLAVYYNFDKDIL